ncbi:hypothetical protein VF13_39680 [Nostoc linckia z16]|nr:hypothetical protein VF13_39680 [Nostoc linckia z16]
MIAPKGIMPEELFALLVAHTGINQYQAVALFNQHAACGNIDKVIAIGRIGPAPYGFGHYAKHRAAVQLKVSGFYRVYFHRIYLSVVCPAIYPLFAHCQKFRAAAMWYKYCLCYIRIKKIPFIAISKIVGIFAVI